MLRLRKILLSNYLYYVLSILVLIVTIIRINTPKNSLYNINSKEVEGIVTNIKYVDEKLTIGLKAKENLLIKTYIKKKPNINLGDTIHIEGEFTIPSKNTSKNLFNYQKYLQRKNINFIVKPKSIKVIKYNNNNIYYKIKNIIINHLGNNPYLNTFLLGDKSLLKEDVQRSYQENGISHLFAISGMHISLLATIIEKLIRKKVGEEKTFKITSAILILYLFLVGLSPSILRGVLFYIIFRINNIYYFYIKPINLYIVIISISLFINPSYIFDVGFQYSYIISFALITLRDKLKSNNYIKSLLKVSIISFLVSIPITLYNFKSINLLSIIYNIFYVPLISLVIFPLSLLTAMFMKIEPIYNISIIILEKSSLYLSKIQVMKLIFKSLPFPIYIIYFLLIILYITMKNKAYIYIFISILLVHYMIPYIDKSDYIKMIDVGQGDSILIHSNNKSILIDTGGNVNSKNDGKIFYNTISPILKSEGIKKLDYLIITHGDKDHIGEAKTIINNIKVKNILINNNKINYLEEKILTKRTEISKEGKTINLGDFKLIQLNENLENENDSSSIYLLKYKNIKVLLTGDASIKSEQNLLKKYKLGYVDILKVGHHGSNTSTSKELIKEINPKVSLISVGKNNKYNHPNKEVLENLSETKIYRTDKDGTINIFFNKRGYFISSEN